MDFSVFGQTNWIKFIAFVCPLHASVYSSAHPAALVTDRRIGKKLLHSSVHRGTTLHASIVARIRQHSSDGQTNWIKFIAFVCPSWCYTAGNSPSWSQATSLALTTTMTMSAARPPCPRRHSPNNNSNGSLCATAAVRVGGK